MNLINEVLHRLANSEFAELDHAIAHLTDARKSRAAMRARVAFKTGDEVAFPWPSRHGYRMLVGSYIGPAPDGKVRIGNVRCADNDSDRCPGDHIVDAAIVNHADSP